MGKKRGSEEVSKSAKGKAKASGKKKMKTHGVGQAREMLKTTRFSRNWKVKARFVQNRLLPKDNFHKFNMLDMAMLYALHFEIPIDVGLVLYTELWRERKDQRAKLMCIDMIHGMCLKAGVKDYDADERYPKKAILLSPLNENSPGAPPVEGAAPPEGGNMGEQAEFVRKIPFSTHSRFMLMDGVRSMLDRQRVQLNTLTRGMIAQNQNTPGFPPLKLDDDPYVFTDAIEEVIIRCLEEDEAEAAFYATQGATSACAGPADAPTAATTTATPGSSQTVPATATTSTADAPDPVSTTVTPPSEPTPATTSESVPTTTAAAPTTTTITVSETPLPPPADQTGA